MLPIVLPVLAAIRTELLALVVMCPVLVMTLGWGRQLQGLVMCMLTLVMVLLSRQEPVTPPVVLLRQVTARPPRPLMLFWRLVTARKLVRTR